MVATLRHRAGSRRLLLWVPVVTTLCLFAFYTLPLRSYVAWPHPQQPQVEQEQPDPRHPIHELIARAEASHQEKLSRRTTGVAAAAAAYRTRRGRNPPPRFDEWVEFAEQHDAIIVEDYFDQIYDDIAPFWGVEPRKIREQAEKYFCAIKVRSGIAEIVTDKRRDWMDDWGNLFQQIQDRLPDASFPMNEMDESRIFTPWDQINEYMGIAERQRAEAPTNAADFVRDFGSLPEPKDDPVDYPWVRDGSLWDKTSAACPPNSVARHASSEYNEADVTQFLESWPQQSYQGYVSNWTSAKHPCDQPHIRHLHGTFIEPISQSAALELIPMFGGSKLPINNDILVPAPAYWTDNPLFQGAAGHTTWEWKDGSVVWRGTASGGRNRDTTWMRFQRHRFVAMTNGSIINANLHGSEIVPDIFPIRQAATEAYVGQRELSDWMDSITDARFMDLFCFPTEEDGQCRYSGPFFEKGSVMPMPDQYHAKYLPDIDGNSFSGRYLAFLRSKSLPIKATIYSEWHDSRLIAWKHFVPMDNTFIDFYGILNFFLDPVAASARDRIAEKLASDGEDWAGAVLRKEDMLIYVYRLALEYARVSDDRRNSMGYVQDLLDSQGTH